jgi:ubiquinol-cytochrome c reductase cytochrome c1 subunit
MSVLAKARKGGPDYIRALISGYATPPEGLEVPPGKYYNPYLHGDLSSFWKGDPHHVPEGGLIAMPPQLTPDRVTYTDGTKATPEQMATDVAAFLAWTADPKAEERKALGFQVMAFLLLLTVLVYLAYRQVWAGTKH